MFPAEHEPEPGRRQVGVLLLASRARDHDGVAIERDRAPVSVQRRCCADVRHIPAALAEQVCIGRCWLRPKEYVREGQPHLSFADGGFHRSTDGSTTR